MEDKSLAMALGKIPSGLFIVTWRDGNTDRGMLASWVMQAGFSPPALTIAVAPKRDLLDAIDRGTSFVVNILSDSQRSLLARFGKPLDEGDDPFSDLSIQRTASGTAAFEQSPGWLECKSIGRAGGGQNDHVIVFAEVFANGVHEHDSPLVHIRKNGLRY